MTKWHDSNRGYIPRADTPISISSNNYEDVEDKTFYCKYCNRSLVWLRDSSGANADTAYFCTFCSTTTYPDENTRRKPKVKPRDEPPDEPAISLLPERTLQRKKNQPRGSFRTLQERGAKITSYKDTFRREKESE